MKSHEIREKTVDEVRDDLLAAEENLQTIRFQLVTSQLENTAALNAAKKEVARLKTVLREHELSIHPLGGVAAVEEEGAS